MIFIESLQNDRIKRLVHWIKKSSLRKKDQIFLVEGEREIQRAIKSGCDLKELFLDEEYEKNIYFPKEKAFFCSKEIFKKIVVRNGTVKALAVFKRPYRNLDNIQLPKKPVVLILDGIEKPGNVGALMRTANAVSVDAVIFSSLKCDPLSPHSVRNSLGGIFNTPWFEAKREDAIKFVLESNLKCFLMDLDGADFNFDQDLSEAYAIVLGSEDEGINDEWSRVIAKKVKIPMNGIVDSLNVSVAGAIILYEFRRQRMNFGK